MGTATLRSEAAVTPNLRLAEKPPRQKNSILDAPGVRAMFAFSRSWSRAVSAEPRKSSGPRGVRRP